MSRVDLEDEVMLLRAQVKVLKNELLLCGRVGTAICDIAVAKDNEIMALKEQLRVLNDIPKGGLW